MKTLSFLFLIVILFAGCRSNNHFISDKAYRSLVEQQFEKQKDLAAGRSEALFSVFNQKLTGEEKEALEFLYAFMPLSDLADYNGEFFLKNVRTAFEARDNFSWGKKVPEDIFRHFVLPYRINNENLDSARQVFYNELKDRVKNLSMREAALEVNHWCHEKVNYRGTDIRTSAPLSTVKNGFGRCGEESTFTVTAMRSVGIPSRQIYTPRWAHCDDNHAWVEVWIEGKWYFLGACEPEPDLNMGWFAIPATRAMLLHTRVYGQYNGTDEVVTKDQRYTEINVIPNYAPAKRLTVKVEDNLKHPVNNALVEFKLYNYAEFYSISKANTDNSGKCSLLTGFGDLLIWASKDGKVAYKKISIAKTDSLVLTLDNPNFIDRSEDYDLVPPAPGKIAEASEKGRDENNKRLKHEDELRFNYEKTFIDSSAANELAKKLTVNADSLWKSLKTSRGNWKDITTFIESAQPINRAKALLLMSVISEKDHHDTPAEVLNDHLLHSNRLNGISTEIFSKYVLNPRIANELVSPYKGFLQEKLSADLKIKIQNDPKALIDWINQQIKIDDLANTSRVPIKPRGVFELKVSDKFSRDIFFVAVCRSIGVPARIEETRSIPQYYDASGWHDVVFEVTQKADCPKGMLTLSYNRQGNSLKPEYYSHFTLGKFDGSRYKTLDYEFSSAFANFPAKLTLDTGRYVLITGVRLQDGSVLSRQKYFTLSEKKPVELSLEFREKPMLDEKGYGLIPMDHEFTLYQTSRKKSIKELSAADGMVILWIDPDKEPTKHTMSDILKLKSNFDQWSGSLLFLVKPDRTTSSFAPVNYPGLPVRNFFAIDQGDYLSVIEKSMNQKFNNNFPVVLVTDTTGKVVYFSSGYKIGNGEQILKQIEEMRSSNNRTCTIKH